MSVTSIPYSKTNFIGAKGSRQEALKKIKKWIDTDYETRTRQVVPCLEGPYLVGKSWLIEHVTKKQPRPLGKHNSPLSTDDIREFVAKRLSDKLKTTRRLRPYVQVLNNILFDSTENPEVRLKCLKLFKDVDLTFYYLGSAFLAQKPDDIFLNLAMWLGQVQDREIFYVRTTYATAVSNWLCRTLRERGITFLMEKWCSIPSAGSPSDYPESLLSEELVPTSTIGVFALTTSEALDCISQRYKEAFPESRRAVPEESQKILECAGTHPGFCDSLARDWFDAKCRDNTQPFERWFEQWIQLNYNAIQTWWHSLPRHVSSMAETLFCSGPNRLTEDERNILRKYGILLELSSLTNDNNRWEIPKLIKCWHSLRNEQEGGFDFNQIHNQNQTKEKIEKEYSDRREQLNIKLNEIKTIIQDAKTRNQPTRTLEEKRGEIEEQIRDLESLFKSTCKHLKDAKTPGEIEQIYAKWNTDSQNRSDKSTRNG